MKLVQATWFRALVAVLVVTVFTGLYRASNSTSAPGTVWVSTAGVQPLDNNGSGGSVVITYDDGPGAYTQNLLAMLQALHVHVVFFNLGMKMKAHPELTREEWRDGDVVANHSWDLPRFPPLSSNQTRQELTRSEEHT